MTWRFTGEDLAEECFPCGCCLQHNANTDTIKMQVTIEEAKGAQSWKKKISCWEQQSWKKNVLLRETLSVGTEDLIVLHDCYRQTCVQLFWIQNFKMLIFFCLNYRLNMLEIWIQMILKGSICIPVILLCVQPSSFQKHTLYIYIYIYIYIYMNSYMNSEYTHLIHIFIYSWIHIFMSIWIQMNMNSYNHFMHEFIWQLYEFICLWIHIYEFIYEFI